MTFLQRFMSAFKAAGSGDSGHWFYTPGTDVPMYSVENYENTVNLSLKQNAIISACFNKIVTSVLEAPIRAYMKKDGALAPPDHRVNQILRNPCQMMSEENFWTRYFAAYYFHGNAFIHKIRNGAGRVISLAPLRPDRMEIVSSKTDYISYYQYKIGSDKYVIEFKDIMHNLAVDPLNDYYGMPVLKSAFREIDTDNDATDFTKVVFQNKGVMPGHVISVKEQLDDKKRERMVASFKAMFGGSNRGSLALVESDGMQIHTLNHNMNDLAFVDLRNVSEARLCMAFQVPPILIGTNLGLQRSTFSNYEEARRAFYEDTIEPIQSSLIRILNDEIISEIDPGIEVKCDYSEVSAFAPKRKQQRDEAIAAWNAGVMMLNEARTRHNLEIVDGGDIFKPTPTKATVDEQGTKSRHLKLLKKSDPVQQLVESGIARVKQAETWIKLFESVMKSEFKKQAADITEAFESSVSKKMSESDYSDFQNKFNALEAGWIISLQEASEPVMMKMLSEAGLSAALDIGFDFDLSSETQQAFVREHSYKFANKVSKTTSSQVRELMLEVQKDGLSYAEITTALTDVYKGWSVARVEMIARTEVIRAANAGAEQAYMAGGIQEKQWLAADDMCDFCQEMDGKIVSVGSNFMDYGASLTVGDDDNVQTMTANYEAIETPPLHPHCRCAIVPVIN